RRALALDPKDAQTHYNLGVALYAGKDLSGAITSYRQVLALNPRFAEAHCNLGVALLDQGRFAESLKSLQRGHALGSRQPGWPYPSAQWVSQAQRLADLEARLPAFRSGGARPKDNAERLDLARVCQAKKLHLLAARLYDEAFTADPRRADDLRAGHRYNAAYA